MSLLISSLIAGALAQDLSEPTEDPPVEVHGDAKLFFVASLPQDLDATGIGVADFRLKGQLKLGEHFTAVAHHNVTWFGGGGTSPLGSGASAGVGLLAPELVQLTWTAPTNGDVLTIRGRTDRLWLRWSAPGIDVTVGRQPVTFGSGLVFTPMDMVNPFSPAVIDTEYKPGVDAVRVDAYAGVSTRISALAAWSGIPIHDADRDGVTLRDVILVANAQATIGVTDIQILGGWARDEGVFGAGFSGSIGAVAIYGDGTVTLPAEEEREEDPFVRAVVGASFLPTTTTSVSTELYYAGLGAADPADYLSVLTSPRFSRGEIWQVGRFYGSLAISQEITPLISASVAGIVNIEDPSAFIAPTVSWSVSDEAALAAGAYFGVGRSLDLTNPLVPEFRSEFGAYPPAAFAQLRAYF